MKHLLFGIFLLLFLISCDNSKQDVVDPTVKATTVQGVLSTIEPNQEREVVTPLPPLPIMVTAAATAVTTMDAPIKTLPRTAESTPVTMRVETATTVPSLGFSGLRFVLTVDGAAQSTFPAGTDEIFALWEYSGMSPTDNIRRIWFRDDQIWLTREEGWNWGEYGSNGTMRDISVYDDEGSGLASATYRLQLYVNDELQAEATFVVLGP